MFVKLENGVPTQWPVSQDRIRFEHKSVSFPRDMRAVDVRAYGFAPFKYSDPQEHDAQWQEARELAPVELDGVFVQQWTIVEKYTAEEKAAMLAQQAEQAELAAATSVRNQRNALLTASDWTQVADAPVDAAAWATYRQALRDITLQAGFPHSVTWPTQPE